GGADSPGRLGAVEIGICMGLRGGGGDGVQQQSASSSGAIGAVDFGGRGGGGDGRGAGGGGAGAVGVSVRGVAFAAVSGGHAGVVGALSSVLAGRAAVVRLAGGVCF